MSVDKTICIDPLHPDPDTVSRAGKIILDSGTVVFPTQCLYGIGALALDKKAVEKVFRIKQRPPDKPILILIPDLNHLRDLVRSIPETAEKLIQAFWPGRLTLVFEAGDAVLPALTAGTGRIGIRMPSHPVAKALVDYVGHPVTGTSANLSGRPGASRIDRLDQAVIEGTDLVLDAGRLKGGTGSTIVDVTVFPVQMIRAGEIPACQIHEILHNFVDKPCLLS